MRAAFLSNDEEVTVMKKRFALLLAALILCLSACASIAEEPTYRVGICQLVQHEALDAATLGFKDTLTALLGERVTFDEQNGSGDLSACYAIVNSFVSQDVDLILANATQALQAARTATGEIPILGASVTDYPAALDMDEWNGVTGVNISGTSDLAPLDDQAALIQELFPEVESVGLLYCSAEANSIYQVNAISDLLTDMGYRCTRYAFVDTNDVFSVTQSACETSDVLYIPTDNVAASCAELIRNVVEVEGVPVVAGDEGICAGCGVATLCIDYYELGCATGEMAYEVLVNGADVSTMPIGFAPSFSKKYNPELCESLGVVIPDGYEAIG